MTTGRTIRLAISYPIDPTQLLKEGMVLRVTGVNNPAFEESPGYYADLEVIEEPVADRAADE